VDITDMNKDNVGRMVDGDRMVESDGRGVATEDNGFTEYCGRWTLSVQEGDRRSLEED
jgi:hypothetical protein